MCSADTDAGALRGLGYATAEDRAFQMTYSLRIIQGRLAEVIGDVRQVNRNETSVDHDRKMRTFASIERRSAREPPGPGNARLAAGLLRRRERLFFASTGTGCTRCSPKQDCNLSRGHPPIVWRRGGIWDSSSLAMARGT